MAPKSRSMPSYAAVWRWHFYAGLFCIPFVLWLSLTGSIYLFRPQVEALIERRVAARAAKDFASADAIRGELDALGVVVMDNPTGATWRMKDSVQ